jgi:class 3 adenylate cyclase/pimeloyl-ACP methyl ester carboxylesterase
MPPQTRYARSGDVRIAYQVVGDGPRDLVIVPGFVSHVDLSWEHPPYERFMERLATFARVLVFDKRGSGLSDPVHPAATLEERIDDVRAVMDAAGSERAALLGISEGAPMSALFAAGRPDRIEALILYGAFARGTPTPDYPWAMPDELWEEGISGLDESWGHGFSLLSLAPSQMENRPFYEWWCRFERQAASPGVAAAALRLDSQIDVREVLPTVRVPTLVLHRSGDFWSAEGARWVAGQVPGGRYVELPGEDHWPWIGDSEAMIDEVEEFLTGERHEHEPDRVLATVLFTDIVGSTERATQLGDQHWRDLLGRHDRIVRKQLDRHRGREIKSIGDGFLATFDGPARAIRCARSICSDVRTLGLEVRAGIHTGECELMNGDVAGIAVHIGARVVRDAGPGEVLVSSTVRDLVVGSGIQFEDRGKHALKGAPGEWRLYAVD